MPVFEYESLDPQARKRKGTMEAETTEEVIAVLQDRGLNPLSVIELGEDGKPVGGNGAWAIIGIAFLIGAAFPWIRRSIRNEFIDYGPVAYLGIPIASGSLFAITAALLTLTERIKNTALKSVVFFGGIFLIVLFAIGTLMLVAEILGWE